MIATAIAIFALAQSAGGGAAATPPTGAVPPRPTVPDTRPAPPTDSPPAAPAPPVAPPAVPPSLDEALGLGKQPDAKDDGGHADGLARSLEGGAPQDILASVIDDMKRSTRLLESGECGLSVRRPQESAVRKLDELIATAQRIQEQQRQSQQSQGSQQQQGERRSNSRSGEQNQDQEQSAEQRERGKKPGPDAARSAGERRRTPGDATANEPPPTVDPTTNDASLDESRTEWGSLPPRVRDAVRQGLRDPVSAAYRRLTQDYYRRLAEEGRR